MIVDRTHFGWGAGTIVASAGAALLYCANNDPEVLKEWNGLLAWPDWLGPVPPLRGNFGATPLGLIYGTVALLIFIFAALLGWRRNHSSWPAGRIQVWLKAHIWLTLLTIPLILFHSGFGWGGPMTQILAGLYVFVMVSGFWGLALQHLVPKLMRESLPEETIFEQIPFIRSQLVAQAEAIRGELASQAEEALPKAGHHESGTVALASENTVAVKSAIQFLDQQALPYLENDGASDDQFRLLKLRLPESLHAPLVQVQNLCDEKRRLDLQTRLHYWLHSWLMVHAPASILLVVLTLVHAAVATFIYA